MTAPDRIWIAPTHHSNGVDDFYLLNPKYRGNRGTEYVRADIHAAALASAGPVENSHSYKPEIFEKTYEQVSNNNNKKIAYGYFIENLGDMSDNNIRTNLRTSLEKLAPNYTDEKIIISREQDFASIKGYL